MISSEYLNKTVWATIRPSKIHGVGVFAIRDIPKGTTITDNTIEDLGFPKKYLSMSEAEFYRILPEIRELILDRILIANGFKFYSPNDQVSLISFMNHSDIPNSDGQITLRDISSGEEITENYRQLERFSHIHSASKEHIKFLNQK